MAHIYNQKSTGFIAVTIRLIRRRGVLPIVWSMAVGIFIGAGVTYFFEGGFHLPVAALLGITGIVAGAASGAILNSPRLHEVHRARARSNPTQDLARWDYRPRHGTQRSTETQGAEAGDGLNVIGPIAHFDDPVWFDFPSESAGTEELANSPTPKAYG